MVRLVFLTIYKGHKICGSFCVMNLRRKEWCLENFDYFLCIFLKDYDKNKTRTIFVACAYNVTGITTFDVYATKLLGKITSLYVDGIFSSIVLLNY